MGQADTSRALRELNGAKPLARGGNVDAEKMAGIDAASKKFEAMVLSQMLQPMFAGLKTDGPFGGGFSEEMYRSMLVEEYGRMMADNGGLGIADAVKRQLLSIQETGGVQQ
ncbi:MAG TPA: chemotaxis protein [Rhodospirillaceae bacterium]|nr:chemotaxis protein [Alphaproteobacteria bacterium]MAS49086.1 chemotaxis protein [Alphaproteobacteria bacterium]MAX97312.1 chemotaxis protein [Alphaproteobacteria bacterium]MBN52526.1 chemotaxis protein [Alphaproteobacteria bacterium]HCI47490.1 chemotaxis protein [Rhodospirillaceae bacterium]